jgi:hypothetical protein
MVLATNLFQSQIESLQLRRGAEVIALPQSHLGFCNTDSFYKAVVCLQ